ncbi:DNA cross-link repair 1A protein-like [Paramacrobiotus metropolitanus]|uniref:DNA cross-link repair 1A protein-like n=1 Tax=Paramacrobiotus metropolitanus TaxID=2943436 RepID=UPI0024461E7C|nr:DNA cross-link repair 1A protein-like [Paramacrobiotus metropolitanus]
MLKNRGNKPTVEDDDDIQCVFIETAKTRKPAEPLRAPAAKRKYSAPGIPKRQKASHNAVQKSIKDFFGSAKVSNGDAVRQSHAKMESTISRETDGSGKASFVATVSLSETFPLAVSSSGSFKEEIDPVRGDDLLTDNDGYLSGDDLISSVPESVFTDIVTGSPTGQTTQTATSSASSEVDSKLNFRSRSFPFPRSSGLAKRKCPFYKLLPGTNFSVDAFNFGEIPNVFGYFLSHFHSDHYIGLTKRFCRPIYCSAITARLVASRLGVDAQWINAVPMDVPVTVDGIEVTLLEANHCPGSVLFLFRMQNGTVYLHTGDFRADPSVIGKNPFLQNLRNISKLYLDTTYLDPYYDFVSQDAAVEFAAELAQQYVKRNPKTLIICGTYSVGKEKIFMRIAECLGCKVAVMNYKLQLLKCFEWENLNAMLTNDWQSAQVHVLPMRSLNLASLEEHLMKHRNYNEVLALLPTGWEYNKKLLSLKDIKPKKMGPVSLYGLPYSEHSSYRELEWFVKFLRPKEVIPTVNVGNPKTRQKMQEHLRNWLMDPSSRPKPILKQNSITNFTSPFSV